MNESVDLFRDWDAAYVLGALSSDDRRLFEHHLATCQDCTTAVAQLAGIPGILTRIDVGTAIALASASTQDPLPVPAYPTIQKLARTAHLRQRRRRLGLVAGMASAAAVLVVVGVLAGKAIQPATSLASGPSVSASSGTVVPMSQVEPNSMTADVRVTSKPWGTRFDWSCEYLGSTPAPAYAPATYDLVVTDISGAQTVIATWSATGPKAVGLSASSGIPISNLRSVEIRAAGAVTPLVRGEL